MEDLLHRNPGNASTLAPAEAAFAPLVKAWVAAEPGARGSADGAAEAPADAEGEAAGSSFTRVVVSSLKPEILRQIADEEGGQQLCRYAPAQIISRHSVLQAGPHSTGRNVAELTFVSIP